MGRGRPTKNEALGLASNARSKNQSGVLGLIQHIVRRHKVLLDRISRAEELADAIAFDLARLEGDLEAVAQAQPSDGSFFAAWRNSFRTNLPLRQTAESGAFSLEVKPRADGSAEVRIDAGKRLTLPPILADLLSILSIDTGQSEDDLIGWKTLDEVAILLGKKSGGRFSKHAVTQQVYRLRKELFSRGGVNPFLVQTNRRLGVRFALRRQSAPVIENDGQ